MSTKKSTGKLEGKQSARQKMRYDSTALVDYNIATKQEQRSKMEHRLRPKGLPLMLGAIYPHPPKENK